MYGKAVKQETMGEETIQELINAADALYANGQSDAAMEAYRSVIHQDPTQAWAHSRLGAILAQKGDLAAAEMAINRAIELDPRLAQAHSNLGNVYYARGDYDHALTKYKNAVEIDPNNPIFHQNLHAAYKKLGRISEAVAALKQSHRLGRADARGGAGQALGQMKRRYGCLTTGVLILMVIVAGVVLSN